MKIQLLSLLLFSFSQVYAQRETDLEITILSPQNGEYIHPEEVFYLGTDIRNNGSDVLLQTDTLRYALFMNGIPVTFFPENSASLVFTGYEIQPGESIFIERPMFLSSGFDHSDLELCVNVVPENAADSVVDPELSDNTGCVTIHVDSEAGVAESAENAVMLVPNPSSGKSVLIQSAEPLMAISVHDVAGHEIQVMHSGNSLHCEDLALGTYIVWVWTVTGKFCRRLVIR